MSIPKHIILSGLPYAGQTLVARIMKNHLGENNTRILDYNTPVKSIFHDTMLMHKMGNSFTYSDFKVKYATFLQMEFGLPFQFGLQIVDSIPSNTNFLLDNPLAVKNEINDILSKRFRPDWRKHFIRNEIVDNPYCNYIVINPYTKQENHLGVNTINIFIESELINCYYRARNHDDFFDDTIYNNHFVNRINTLKSDADFVVVNNDSKKALYKKVQSLCEVLR